MSARRKPRGDGFKKIDRIVVASEMQGNMELPLLFNVHESRFLVEIDGEDVFAKDVKELRAKVEDVLKARETLTWERWVVIDYTARYKNGWRDYTRDLNEEPDDPDEEQPDKSEDVLTEMSFVFQVFDLSSPITLTEEARRIHRAQRWGDPPTHERLRRWVHLREGAWIADDENGRVDADILDEKNKVYRLFTDDLYASLVAIRAGLKNLDVKLRATLESPHLLLMVRGLPMELPAPTEPEPEPAPAKRRRRA